MHACDPVQSLRGIGPRLSEQLAEVGVLCLRDLLLHTPKGFEDRSRVTPLDELNEAGVKVLVRCTITKCVKLRTRRRNVVLTRAELADDSGVFTAVWFDRGWHVRTIENGETVFLYGSVRHGRNGLQLVQPEVEKDLGQATTRGIVPVYAPLGPLSGRRLRRFIEACLPALDSVEEPVPDEILSAHGVMSICQALRTLHQPDDRGESLRAAAERLAFDEALTLYCTMTEHIAQRNQRSAARCSVDDRLRKVARHMLPFTLTTGQKAAIRTIVEDLQRGRPMARLLQGDVGSGKTAVAAMAMLVVVENGFQCALMAPTEILAEQHFRSLTELFEPTGTPVELLTSAIRGTEQREIRDRIATGQARVVVGTHALIQSKVNFRELALVVIDEQHRFGVVQRQDLVDKAVVPHVLVMTATPIPRSMALTVFGDLEVSLIPDMPPGRKPVRTVLRSEKQRPKIYDFLRREVREGGRIFIVCPLVESSEMIAARSVEEHVEDIASALPECAVGALHGRMAPDERKRIYREFREGAIQVLVATSIVEVGVDVPAASVMLIENADRFGLAQLHQLRGRVGRGSRQSWCIVLGSECISKEGRRRLEVLTETDSGFEIAERDLVIRGAGELAGTRQWGVTGFRFLDVIRDHDLLERTRNIARELEGRGLAAAVGQRLAAFYSRETSIPTG